MCSAPSPADGSDSPSPGPGPQGHHSTPGNTAEWLDGLKASISTQNYHAVQFISVPCFLGLFLCYPALSSLYSLIHSVVAGHVQGPLLAVHHRMAFGEGVGKKCSVTG